MNGPASVLPPPEPFFFDLEPGTRFCVYHAPPVHQAPRGGVLLVAPFAEEMHRSRRMAALQARALAGLGFAVLQLDHFGCGDSCGDFRSARLPLWQADLQAGWDWLHARAGGPCYLLGLRLGGLLALDFAARHATAGIVLWQPFVRGRTCINQFLRQRLAQELTRPGGFPSSTTTLREELFGHGSLEVAGFDLAADLALAIDALDAANLQPRAPWVEWLACGTVGDVAFAATARRLARRWPDTEVRFQQVAGPPFWSLRQHPVAPALLNATTLLFARVPA
ncbi:MAG: hydrolase 2, exosortase A system-associated [Telluria sp.]